MIDWTNAILTSASMAVDAMTVNATNGLKEKNMPVWKMIIISFCFGLAQFLMPVIGYFVGFAIKDYVEDYIPRVAFFLLTILAIKSLIEWYENFMKKGCQCEIQPPQKNTPLIIFTQSIATSIDALCIGFVYLSLPTADAMLIFGLIGIVTFVFSFVTVILAKQLACKLEKWAGLIAAIVFLLVGIKILLEGIM